MIPARYFVVELTTAIVFLILFIKLPLTLLLPLSLLMAAVLIVITVYDIYHMVIPDHLVVSMSVLAGIYFFLTYYHTWSTLQLAVHASAAFGAFLFYGGLWFVSKGRWIGFGDAKLAIPLGFILGAPAVFSFVVLSFWIGALISIVLLIWPAFLQLVQKYAKHTLFPQHRTSLTMKSEVPFAPFMVIAFFIVYVFHIDVLLITSFFI